ncbi:hypothetical protein BDR05DRAFT_953191 [Suillus weaverae]|nr:hypothetical protein BDR05DRAFT_953191 [Suillus weaverae]
MVSTLSLVWKVAVSTCQTVALAPVCKFANLWRDGSLPELSSGSNGVFLLSWIPLLMFDIFCLLKMNPPDSLGTDSNFARTNAPTASDHHVAPSQVQYFDHFRLVQAYSTHENFLEGPGHSWMHPPHAMYRDSEYSFSHTYSLSFYPAGPSPPGPNTCGLVPPTIAKIQPPSILPIALAEAVSDEELEQPLLAPAKGQKRLSAPTVQPSRAPLKKPTKVGGKGKGPAMAQPDPDTKLVVGEVHKKGQKAGVTGYSADKVNHMLKVIGRHLPLSGKAWNAVMVTYNQWAQQNNMMERSSKAIQAKYDMICCMEKPTRDGELPEYVELTHQTEDAIMRKSAMIALDDSEWDKGDIGSEIEGRDVVEVTSESDGGERGVKAKHTGPKKTVVKAFRANPLLEPSTQRPRNTAASDALSSLTSVFNPAVIKDCDETWLSSLVQFNQINTLQAKLCEARQCIESLNDCLMQECHCADHAESQVEMLNFTIPFQLSLTKPSTFSLLSITLLTSSTSMPGPSHINDNTVFDTPHALNAPSRSNGLKSLALAANIAAGDKGVE